MHPHVKASSAAAATATLAGAPSSSSSLSSSVQQFSGKQHRTLDLEHLSTLRRLGRDRSNADRLRAEAAEITRRIQDLESKPMTELNDDEFEDLKRSRHRHDRVTADASDAEARGDEIDYFVRTSGILFRYYDIVDKGVTASSSMIGIVGGGQVSSVSGSAVSSAASAPGSTSGGSAPRSILSYFSSPQSQQQQSQQQQSQQQSQQQTQTPSEASSSQQPASTSSPSPPEPNAGKRPVHHHADDRAALFDRYLLSVDSDNPVSYSNGGRLAENAVSEVSKSSFGTCGHCGSTDRAMQLQDGYVFCRSCQTVEYVLVDHDKPSYKDPPKEVAYFAYKRINHFNEWLNQVQGKETTEIPEEVYDLILLEVKKQKVTNMAMLSKKLVKDILKKLRINKFYEHVPHIINRLNGIPSPHLSPELEDKLRHMFCQIQVPFFKHAPSFRKNFLSYSFCLNKMMQLLEKDQYLDSFPLLKSREKLHQQDMIWQKICAEIGWDFIPSL